MESFFWFFNVFSPLKSLCGGKRGELRGENNYYEHTIKSGFVSYKRLKMVVHNEKKYIHNNNKLGFVSLVCRLEEGHGD